MTKIFLGGIIVRTTSPYARGESTDFTGRQPCPAPSCRIPRRATRTHSFEQGAILLTEAHRNDSAPQGRYLLTLSIAALGVVFGDIGTSPLYAVRECFHGPHAVAATESNILGILSLIFWSLAIVISVKYLAFVLRADNRGEGGILALMSLIRARSATSTFLRPALLAMGLFGAALLYGDGIITPAISILSALEGLRVAAPAFDPWVIPGSIVVLVGLFLVQRHGTGGVGAIFGPITFVWFVTLGVLGAMHIAREPHVFASINPIWAIRFFAENGKFGFLALGSVFLVVTGGEALYADMGHFGRRPIRLVWFALVLPALLLNYLGQGALLLRRPEAAANLFYEMVPEPLLYPMVALATTATVIASQAVISGAFSLTRQAAQLGYTPRVSVKHTSAREIGQIYIPSLNWVLMLACIGLVLGFRTSSNLAAAYGVAVTTTMAVTTLLLLVVAIELWRWPVIPCFVAAALFLVVDLAFFGANIIKIWDGGWFPLAVAGVVFTLMTTWRRGRKILNDRLDEGTLGIDMFIKSVEAHPPLRVPGTAVFMNRATTGTPPALLHNIKHNKVLHERVILLSIRTEEVSHVLPEERLQVETLGCGLYRVIAHFGFMESPDVPEVLKGLSEHRIDVDPAQVSYFLGRETLIATRRRKGMALWREKLFSWMSRNATGAVAFFGLPPNRVVELGSQIEL